MVTESPPVSPSVVARILMIQKPSVTAGTLVSASCRNSRSVISLVSLIYWIFSRLDVPAFNAAMLGLSGTPDYRLYAGHGFISQKTPRLVEWFPRRASASVLGYQR